MLLITALQGEKPLTTGQPLAEQSRAVAAELCVHNTILISLLVASKGLVNLGTDWWKVIRIIKFLTNLEIRNQTLKAKGIRGSCIDHSDLYLCPVLNASTPNTSGAN